VELLNEANCDTCGKEGHEEDFNLCVCGSACCDACEPMCSCDADTVEDLQVKSPQSAKYTKPDWKVYVRLDLCAALEGHTRSSSPSRERDEDAGRRTVFLGRPS
jgi:hypothetical protein